MKVIITPKALSGSVEAIPSKSYVHRLLICCALADARTRFELPFLSEDIEATAACLRALGADITYDGSIINITPIASPADYAELDCGESGSTLRFLLPVAAVTAKEARFTGSGRLPFRPLSALTDEMKRHGVRFDKDTLAFNISGRLTGGEYNIAGNVSSQFISGLLIALARTEGDSVIKVTTKLESISYIDLTVEVLRQFGVSVELTDGGYRVRGGQTFGAPKKIKPEADWSNAAFFLAAGAVAGDVRVTGLSPSSLQGDKRIVKLLKRFGAGIVQTESSVRVSAGRLNGFDTDVSDIPDLLPALAVAAAFAEGKSVFYNAGRLRLKESDRLSSTLEMLRSLGGQAEISEDTLTVFGGGLRGGTVDSFNDHRIVMAAATAACGCTNQVVINGAQAADKSYPSFFKDYERLGGEICVV